VQAAGFDREECDRGSAWTIVTHRSRTVVKIAGGPPPKAMGIVEWDSVDDAVGFYKSKAWEDLAPQREKAIKVIRRFVVETEK